MIIFRYLAKKVFSTMFAFSGFVALLFMSNQLLSILNLSADGKVPASFIIKLMSLEFPLILWLVLPLGYFIALLLSCSQMYADNEMVALKACGYGETKLLKHCFVIAFLVMLLAALVLYFRPNIMAIKIKLRHEQGIQTLLKTLVPGQFRIINAEQNKIMYIKDINYAHTTANNIFYADFVQSKNKEIWNIFWVDKGLIQYDEKNQESFLLLNNGKLYQGLPGSKDYKLATFKKYHYRLPIPSMPFSLKDDIRIVKTKDLFVASTNKNNNLKKNAELQWRLAIPLMIISLTLVAIPLSRINPREDKYLKLFPAIVLFVIYANCISFSRKWIMNDIIPPWLGMWWLHLLVASLGLFLFWRKKYSH